ncbi:MAG: DUF3794 domain-containing protein [Oscillospiraceae bacterium]|nr:DUF3794 domain-containing protein [Oscillospiraceae bacterium]
MATQLFYDHLLSTAKIADINSEQPVEAEFLLADYDAPVFKIVKTTMNHVVTQKYIMQNKLTVEGFIKIAIFYQPPEGEKLSVVNQKVPFQKQLELAAADCDLNFINIQGQSQYVNTRPQNPTRIDVRGAYMFSIKVFGRQKTNAITKITGGTVCCDSGEIPHFYLAGQNIRQFTAENELALPEDMIKVLRVHTTASTPAISVYQDKITVKGEVNAEILCTVSGSDQIKTHTQVFPYNQIIDMNGIQENHICCADVSVCSFGISQNQENKKYTAAVTVQIDASAFSKQQVISVYDAFSRLYLCEKTSQEILCDTNMYSVDRTLAVRMSENTGRDCVVKDIIFEIAPVKSYFEINKTTVKSKITANIITMNGQKEYECVSKTEDIVLDWLEKCGQHDEICIKLSVSGCTYTHTEGELQINANISAQGFVIEKQPFSLLKTFAENTEEPVQTEDALIVYYAHKGEKVFDIARNHNADPQDIIEENSLQKDIVDSDRMLFVPAFTEQEVQYE